MEIPKYRMPKCAKCGEEILPDDGKYCKGCRTIIPAGITIEAWKNMRDKVKHLEDKLDRMEFEIEDILRNQGK